uniref:Bm10608, isoform c n=1 Tax=Brugia malayi TaxID=6279 RepID=A0A1I9G425_BRUMA|nr:Bm10608, isoform c [Brugia malayi]
MKIKTKRNSIIMSSDRFKRKEIRTLKQRWIMKHKDRRDDIPNCPSIEDISDMPIPNEILPPEKTETSNVITDSSISNAKLPNGTIQSQTTSTAQENSTKSTGHETSIVPKRSHRNYRKRQRHWRKSSKRHSSSISKYIENVLMVRDPTIAGSYRHVLNRLQTSLTDKVKKLLGKDIYI